MASPFVAEIRIFPFNFPPKGWAFCDGQLMPISQNTALFSLLGTTYGGDGKSNFALPNLQGSAPMHPGQGPGLSLHDLGEQSGSDTVTLIDSELPSHGHFLQATTDPGTAASPSGDMFANGNWSDGQGGSGGVFCYTTAAPNVSLSGFAVAPSGGGQPHNNLMPYLTLNFCIALQGVFPPRS
jgi:microcystin-dependent protein